MGALQALPAQQPAHFARRGATIGFLQDAPAQLPSVCGLWINAYTDTRMSSNDRMLQCPRFTQINEALAKLPDGNQQSMRYITKSAISH